MTNRRFCGWTDKKMRGFTLTPQLLAAMAVALSAWMSPSLFAQDLHGPPSSPSDPSSTVGSGAARGAAAQGAKLTPLAAKQQMIQDRFQRFQDRLFRLAEELAEREPQNAARLSRAISRAGELGLSDRLAELVRILENSSYLYDAAEAQGSWLVDADRLLGILLERDSDNQERREEIERLQEYRKRVGELLENQRELRDAAAAAKAAEQMRRSVEQAIESLEQMRRRQAAIRQQSQDGSPPTIELQQRQVRLSEDARKLAERLEKLSAPLDDETEAQAKALNEARERIAEASKETKSGSKSMSQAGKDLESGNRNDAAGRQEKAEKDLQNAIQRLEAARESLEEHSRTGQQARDQNALADKTHRLSQQMKQSSEPGGQPDGQGQQGGDRQDPQGPDGPTPGQDNVERAESEMRKAGGALEEQMPGEALPKEDRAIDELEQAKRQLEDRLRQLRQEEKEETLRDLESRFREMLVKQKPINEETLILANVPRDELGRAEKLRLADLSARQRALSQEAQKCLHILDEDGTTIAFPRVVEQLSQDMETVADRLAAAKLGAITQTIEREIVNTLEQLLDAVQKMQQENEQQQQASQQANSSEPPLLPKSAELKLLRSSQQRINTRTITIETSVAEGNEAPQNAASGLKKLAARQEECMDIARKMRDRPE